MKLISKTIIKVEDVKEHSISNYNETNFLYIHPELADYYNKPKINDPDPYNWNLSVCGEIITEKDIDPFDY